MTTGHCIHGEFTLEDGCIECIAEKAKAHFEDHTIDDAKEDWERDQVSLTLRPGEDLEAHDYYKEALRLLEYAKSRAITTLDEAKSATDDLAIISKVKKAMEAKKKEKLEPLKVQTQAIRDTYDYLMSPVLEAEKFTKEKHLIYLQEQKRIREEQEEVNRLRMEAAQKEAALNNGEITESVNLVEVSETHKRVSTDMGSTGMTDHWKYEVTDFASLPDEYKVADTAMLNTIAKKHHDQKQIKGVKFYNEPIIATRVR